MPILGSILIPLFSEASAMALILIFGIVIGVIVFHHAICVAIAHLFHPHVLGIVLGVAVIGLLLAVFFGFWAMPGQPMFKVVSGTDMVTVESGGQSPTWIKLFFLAAVVAGIVVAVFALSGQINLHFSPGWILLAMV